jgi:hypothetical protein
MEKRLYRALALQIINLPLEEQTELLRLWLGNLKERQVSGSRVHGEHLKNLVLLSLRICRSGNSYDTQKAERWMEGMYQKDLSHRPTKVANVYMTVKRIDRRMEPFYVRLAQNVKRKIYMRMIREIPKAKE